MIHKIRFKYFITMFIGTVLVLSTFILLGTITLEDSRSLFVLLSIILVIILAVILIQIRSYVFLEENKLVLFSGFILTEININDITKIDIEKYPRRMIVYGNSINKMTITNYFQDFNLLVRNVHSLIITKRMDHALTEKFTGYIKTINLK